MVKISIFNAKINESFPWPEVLIYPSNVFFLFWGRIMSGVSHMRQVFWRYIEFQIIWQFWKLKLLVISCRVFFYMQVFFFKVYSPVTCYKECTFTYEVIFRVLCFKKIGWFRFKHIICFLYLVLDSIPILRTQRTLQNEKQCKVDREFFPLLVFKHQ